MVQEIESHLAGSPACHEAAEGKAPEVVGDYGLLHAQSLGYLTDILGTAPQKVQDANSAFV